MPKYFSLAAAFTLLLGTAGCGKSEEAPVARKQQADTPAETVTAKPATRVVFAEPQSVNYKPVNARLRLSGEQVVIMVPDNVDIESGRMLEYREGDDGKYYLKSVIPN